MLANTETKNISIWNVDQELLPIFLLALWSYITYLFNMVYLEVIASTQCHLFLSTTMIFHRNNSKEILRTKMLEYLVIHDNSVTAV